MPKRGIDYIFDIMEFLKSQGFENEATIKDIRKAINVKVSFDPKTVHKYVVQMIGLDVITKKGQGVFVLNNTKLDEYR